jgi:hypothetical protein
MYVQYTETYRKWRESTWNDLVADGRVLGKLGWKRGRNYEGILITSSAGNSFSQPTVSKKKGEGGLVRSCLSSCYTCSYNVHTSTCKPFVKFCVLNQMSPFDPFNPVLFIRGYPALEDIIKSKERKKGSQMSLILLPSVNKCTPRKKLCFILLFSSHLQEAQTCWIDYRSRRLF